MGEERELRDRYLKLLMMLKKDEKYSERILYQEFDYNAEVGTGNKKTHAVRTSYIILKFQSKSANVFILLTYRLIILLMCGPSFTNSLILYSTKSIHSHGSVMTKAKTLSCRNNLEQSESIAWTAWIGQMSFRGILLMC